MNESDEEDSCTDNEVELEGTKFALLNEIVRNQYSKFLKTQLDENLKTCWRETDKWPEDKYEEFQVNLIEKCAKNLEDLAIKEAILAQLYQRAMLKMIDKVRCCTKECRIFDELQIIFDDAADVCQQPKTETQATQTEQLEESPRKITLDERISDILTQKQRDQANLLKSKMLKTDYDKRHCSSSQRKRPIECKSQQYEQKRQLRGNSTNSDGRTLSTSMWHSPTPPPAAITAKRSSSLGKQTSLVTNCGSERYDAEAQLAGDEVAEELEKLFTESPDKEFEEIFGISIKDASKNFTDFTESHAPKSIAASNAKIVNHNFRPPVDDLRHSPWPCECFMQKRRLNATLTRLVDEDFRWFDILKTQFSLIFGDFGDPNEDFAQCSPSLELDNIIISSSMRRISPWVVKHLMKPLEEGLIGNRFLFKKLAKKLAHHIITENQYPDELVIKNAIENFFCLHRAVMTAQDFDDIDAIPIVDHDT